MRSSSELIRQGSAGRRGKPGAWTVAGLSDTVDRRIAALFFGIVAIGLGPAVWFGGTVLRTEPAPRAPIPVVTESASPAPAQTLSTPDPSPSAGGVVAGDGAADQATDLPTIRPTTSAPRIPRPGPPVPTTNAPTPSPDLEPEATVEPTPPVPPVASR